LSRSLKLKELNLDVFLELLNQLIRHGFRLREEVYVEAVRKAREIVDPPTLEDPQPGQARSERTRAIPLL